MTEKTSPFEGTNGATITTTNHGGDTFDGATGGVFTNVRSKRGATSATSAAGSQSLWWNTASAPAQLLARGYVYFPSTPASDTILAVLYHTTGATKAAQLVHTATGHARLYTYGSGSAVQQWEDSGAFPTGQWVRYELWVDAGTDVDDGQVRAAIYLDDAVTPLGDSGLISGIDTTGTVGSLSRATYRAETTFDLDDIGFRSGVDAVWGAWISNSAPTVEIDPTVQSPAAGGAFAASATPTDDGSITGYAWTVDSDHSTASPALTGAATADVSGTAPAAGDLVTLQCEVTDDGGLTGAATCEIRVPLAGSADAVPLAIDASSQTGTWTNTGGETTDGAALADASDATYLESEAVSAVEQTTRHRIQPSAARTTMTVTVRLWTDTGAATAVVRLREGTTQRKTWTPFAIDDTPTDYPLVVDATTLAAISDWGDLHVEVGVTS